MYEPDRHEELTNSSELLTLPHTTFSDTSPFVRHFERTTKRRTDANSFAGRRWYALVQHWAMRCKPGDQRRHGAPTLAWGSVWRNDPDVMDEPLHDATACCAETPVVQYLTTLQPFTFLPPSATPTQPFAALHHFRGNAEHSNVSVAVAFQPGEPSLPYPQDVVFVTGDKILFYGHSQVLLAKSSNNFAGLLSPGSLASSPKSEEYTFLSVAESFPVFNIVLHAMYEMPCAALRPSAVEILTALTALVKYGADLQRLSPHGTPLLELATTRLADAPAQFYALAGKYDLYDLAVRSSAHLLSARLQDLPIELVDMMGPIYLQRLISLQLGRQDRLKEVLEVPPDKHAPTATCGLADQDALASAWKLVGSYFIWEMRPDTTPITLDVALGGFRADVRCPICLDAFNRRVAQVLQDWAVVSSLLFALPSYALSPVFV
ncbi:hypothetical protein PHLGIDRAFT_34294 [Phlebiopsis gigantea 11061_1 CR5-6]|uniref:BTB domain-containing protein n=1 Tax=Phlebiopsis gigantea (strain 11061_1 CR5-6) TaxID=745531 RepID=A0A0C3NW72_PHLG1|nr:hypothetical protein PHLGIDRAFT_34294 [Phlebiopsis gigantea 11061_1 CR5-6]